jgi:hypothetical protein
MRRVPRVAAPSPKNPPRLPRGARLQNPELELGGLSGLIVLDEVQAMPELFPVFFRATQAGAQLDLLLFECGRRIGYEFRYSDKPTTSKSMRIAMEDLNLSELRIICPGSVRTKLNDRIEVLRIDRLVKTMGAIDPAQSSRNGNAND